MTKYFEESIRKSDIFEIFTKPDITLVTFRLHSKNGNINEMNKLLKQKLDENTVNGYITPSHVGDIYFLRFVLCNPNTTKHHIDIFLEYFEKYEYTA